MNIKTVVLLLSTTLCGTLPFPCLATPDGDAFGAALGAPQYEWTTSDDPWFVTTEAAFEGDTSVESSGGGGGEVDTWIKTTVSGNAKWMSFLFQKSYVVGPFTVEIDGVPVFTDNSVAYPSDQAWLAVEVFIPAGTHEVKFNYHHSGYGWKNEMNGVRVDAVTMKEVSQDGVETYSLGAALGAAQYEWTTSDNPWFVTTDVFFEGVSCVQSADCGMDVADVWMKTTLSGNSAKKMTFWYQKCYYMATFTVQVDGRTMFADTSISPPSEMEWQRAEVLIPDGKHEVKFNYHHPGYGWTDRMNGVRIDAVRVEDIPGEPTVMKLR